MILGTEEMKYAKQRVQVWQVWGLSKLDLQHSLCPSTGDGLPNLSTATEIGMPACQPCLRPDRITISDLVLANGLKGSIVRRDDIGNRGDEVREAAGPSLAGLGFVKT